MPAVTVKRLLGIRSVANSRVSRVVTASLYAAHAVVASFFGPHVETNVFFTQPPMFLVFGRWLKNRRNQRLVLVLMDLYPHAFFASRVPRAKPNTLEQLMKRAVENTWRSADQVIVIGRCMQERVLKVGVDCNKTRVIHNWVDTTKVRPVSRDNNPLRRHLGFGDEFIILYSGNMGQAHEFATLLSCAKAFSWTAQLQFVIIGNGVRRKFVEETRRSWGLDNVTMLEPVPEDKLDLSFGLGDIHFVSLRPEFTGLMVPSKTYGAFAAGRGVIYEGSPDGEIARLIDEYDVGCIARPNDVGCLVAVIDEYLANPALAAEQGARARRLAESRLDMESCVLSYVSSLSQ